MQFLQNQYHTVGKYDCVSASIFFLCIFFGLSFVEDERRMCPNNN